MSTSSPPADPVGAVRRLHRSREDRILGGVCAGLARYFNIDPTIARIGAAALLLLGGVGIIAYLAAWLLVPEEGSDEPLLRTGIAVEHGRTRVIAGGALLVVALLVIAGRLIPDVSDDLIAPSILALAGILLLVGPRFGGDDGPTAPPVPPGGGTATAPPTPPPSPPSPRPAPQDESEAGDDDHDRDEARDDEARDRPAHDGPGTAVVPAASTAVTRAVPVVPATTGPEAPASPTIPFPAGFTTPAYGGGGSGEPPTGRRDAVPPPPRPPRRPRSPVGLVTLGALLVAGAIMAGVVAVDPDGIPWDTTLAIFTIAMGAILAVAGLFGRARLAVVTAFSVTAVIAVLVGSNLHLTGGVGDRGYRPTGTEAIQPRYELGVGQLRIDLRDATLSKTVPTRIHAELGVGRLLVIVPDDVRLTVNADARAGNVELDTQYSSGTDLERSLTVGPVKGPRVVLDADVGLGSIEVRRGDPPWPTRDGDTSDDGASARPLTTGGHHA